MEALEMRPPWMQSGSELLTTLDTLERAISAAQTYRLQVLARLDETGHAKEVGARHTAELVSRRHRLNPADVKRDLKLAEDLPKYPTVTAALPDPYSDDPEDADSDTEPGATAPVVLSLDQARAIINALNKVPRTVPVEDLQVAEEQMVEAARHLCPGDLRMLGQQVVNTLDTDGVEPSEERAYERERLWLNPVDAGVKFGGFLAAEHAELLQTAIHKLSKPHKTVDGDLDPRPRDKRQADSLVMILEAAAGNTGGSPGVPHMTVTIDFEDLKNRTSGAVGELVFGSNLSAAAVRRMACDAAILPIVLGSNSQPLDVGTEQRFATGPIRRALINRDKGCVICKAPPPHCHAHHIVHWADGGPTSIDNLALFCGHDHDAVHKGIYTVTITDGIVQVTRPTWADPSPTPPRRLPKPNWADPTTAEPTTAESPTPTGPTPTGSAPTRPAPVSHPPTSDHANGLSWLTPAAAARLNPWGEDSNAAPGP